MGPERYDLIVIGGGAANELATRAHRDLGARVVAIEHGRWGGICSTTACKPTKQYLAAAELLRRLRVAPELGIDVAVSPIALDRLRARKDEKVGSDEERRRRGSRRLLGVHAVSPAAGDLVQGYAVALAAGSRLDDLALGHYAFPTFAEGLHDAALAAWECETGLRAGSPDEGAPASTRMTA